MKFRLLVLLSGLMGLCAAQAGDIAAGRAKSMQCISCHGALGVSEHLNWPNFAGQNAGYIAKQLREFRAGTRKDPWMSPMATGLSDTDIGDLAAYFASLPRPQQSNGSFIGDSRAQVCVACHGVNGVIDHETWPNIAGQKKQYLIDQMNRYRNGQRVDPLMTPIAKTLSDADVETLAAFYSSR